MTSPSISPITPFMTDHRRKRLLYRSNYRGFKEADILLGGFAKANMAELSDLEVEQFEALLTERDHDIYDWYTGVQKLPDEHNTPLFAKLKAYKPVL